MFMRTKGRFYKLQNWFESNRVYLQKFSNKNRKEKRKELEKEKRATGSTSSLQSKMAHGPFPSLLNHYLLPLSSVTNRATPLVIPPNKLNQARRHPWRDHREDLPMYDLLDPSTTQRAYLNPPPFYTRPPKP
jgi:hypothetical protein